MSEYAWMERAQYYENMCIELEEEVVRLKKELRETKNKLFNRNREFNRMRDEDFERVEFGRE